MRGGHTRPERHWHQGDTIDPGIARISQDYAPPGDEGARRCPRFGKNRISGLGGGESPHEPKNTAGGNGPDLGPVLRNLTYMHTTVGTLEDKVAHMAHDGVLQRVLASGNCRPHCFVQQAQQMHDAAETRPANQQLKEKQDIVQAQLKGLEIKLPKCAKSEDDQGVRTTTHVEVLNDLMRAMKGA